MAVLRECHVGVGGLVRGAGVGGLVRGVGFGGFRDAIPGGDSGGKGEEPNEQHGGKVWRFEAVGRNGGTGVGSSEEEFGLEDVAGNGVGGVVTLEDRIMSGSCGRIVGTEDCRVVVVEDCRAGGDLKICRTPL